MIILAASFDESDVTRKDFAWLHVAVLKMTQFSVRFDPTWKTRGGEGNEAK